MSRLIILAVYMLTQFSLASDYGSLGYYAESYSPFLVIEVGDIVRLDGELYRITERQEYRAHSPYSIYSSFTDLKTGEFLTVEEVFFRTYGIPDRLVLQTCIGRYGEPAWGRLFLIGIKLDKSPVVKVQLGKYEWR